MIQYENWNIVGTYNHLRVMTASPIALDTTSALVDFTNPATPTYGNAAQAVIGPVCALWSGDANSNSKIIYSGTGNDYSPLLVRVLSAPGNTQASNNYIVPGYAVTDLNLDGKTIAAGPSSDVNVLLASVLSHPSNLAGNTNYIIQEQVPVGVLPPIPIVTPPATATLPPTTPPTLTATTTTGPINPLPTPTAQPTLAASQFPTVEVYILDATTLGITLKRKKRCAGSMACLYR